MNFIRRTFSEGKDVLELKTQKELNAFIAGILPCLTETGYIFEKYEVELLIKRL